MRYAVWYDRLRSHGSQVVQLINVTFVVLYCGLLLLHIFFAKMEEVNFARLKFRDLGEKSC